MFNIILKFIYYTYKNLIYYRHERSISSFDLSTQNDFKYHITNAMLETVGLKISENGNEIPWYIPLSAIQKSWIKKVKEYGYKVDLI